MKIYTNSSTLKGVLNAIILSITYFMLLIISEIFILIIASMIRSVAYRCSFENSISVISGFINTHSNFMYVVCVLMTFFTIYALTRTIHTNRINKEIKKVKFKEIIIFIFVGSLLSLATNLILGLLDTYLYPYEEVLDNHIYILSEVIFGFVGTTIIVPIIEEVIFRYYLAICLEKIPNWMYILISAGLFAIFHNSDQIVYVFLMGMIFAYVWVKKGNILIPIVTHAAFNATSWILGIMGL